MNKVSTRSVSAFFREAPADVLADYEGKLKSYISDQQLKMRSGDDLVKGVKKYNDLR